MNLAQQILEMAAAYRSEFEPGYQVFARRGPGEEVPSMGRYVIGTIGNERGLYQVSTVSSFPQIVPNERLQKLLGKEFGSFEEVEPEVRQALLDSGYEDITEVSKSGTSTYFGGEIAEEGTVQPFEGTLYHGTPDLMFFSTTYQARDLGGGSHLFSLQGGDVFSLTPNKSVAEGYADDGQGVVGMVLEFEVKLTIYYAGREEDDLDEIQYPPEADAVAIPYGRYEEDEIALLQWGDNLFLKALHLKTPEGWERYPVNQGHIEYFGEFSAFLGDYLADCFGEEMNDVFEFLESGDFRPNDADHLNQTADEGIVLYDPRDHSEFCLLIPSEPVIIYIEADGDERRMRDARELLEVIQKNPPNFMSRNEDEVS